MFRHAILAALTAAPFVTAASADPAHDQKLYDDLRYYYNRGDCEVARPLLVNFSGVCAQYENQVPDLCLNISKAIQKCSQQAGGQYIAEGENDAMSVAQVTPLPQAQLGD